MKSNRPTVLSIAGFDPSGGAGILADIKTFEFCDSYGMGVVSSITYQNDIAFEGVEWLNSEQIMNQFKVLKKRFDFEYIKIGLIESLEVLNQLIDKLIKESPSVKIIWDPILRASATFLSIDMDTLLSAPLPASKYINCKPNISPAIAVAIAISSFSNGIGEVLLIYEAAVCLPLSIIIYPVGSTSNLLDLSFGAANT